MPADGLGGAGDEQLDPLEAASETTVSWRELLIETEQRLGRAGLADPKTSARRIVEEASGFEGAALALGLAELATIRGVSRLDAMVARRSGGEPLQYVLGRWGFRHLDLMVDRRVLIPRPETEVVAERALEELQRMTGELQRMTGELQRVSAAPIAVDLGTGSGALGLSLAREHQTAEVWLTDVSTDALDVARANLAGLGRHGARVRILQGSWFAALPVDLAGRVSVIVSNPPYVSPHEELPVEVAAWEPTEALIAEADGYAAYEVLLGEAPRWLVAGGALVVESAPHQVERLREMAADDFAVVEPFDDLSGRRRGIIARLATRR